MNIHLGFQSTSTFFCKVDCTDKVENIRSICKFRKAKGGTIIEVLSESLADWAGLFEGCLCLVPREEPCILLELPWTVPIYHSLSATGTIDFKSVLLYRAHSHR